MQKSVFLFVIFFITNTLQCQINSVTGIRQNSLGNTGSNISDLWSVKNNPGSFAFMNGTQASLIYQNRFLISELASQAVAFGHSTDIGNVGFFFNHTGFSLFRTLQLGGTYAIELSPRLGMGVNFNYNQTRFGDIYGVKHHFLAGIGIQYKLKKNVLISGVVQNVNRSKVSDIENERLPTFFNLGISYQISDQVLWLLDLEKELASQINVKSGVELAAHEYLDVRLGVNSFPFQSSFGFGTHFKQLKIDLAANWHSQFGLAPSFGFLYKFE
ncbi:MAG: hypothetical protein AB8B72_13260 [Crocinitomicaceae bacterium]